MPICGSAKPWIWTWTCTAAGRRFKGRISGFTMGTGSTLALLPAENATGNFVKVVQRLPVRIELVDYDPDKTPLFVGLSVTPYVHIKEPPTGPTRANSCSRICRPPTTRAGRSSRERRREPDWRDAPCLGAARRSILGWSRPPW